MWGKEQCNPLGMPADLAEQLIVKSKNETVLCPNCLAKRHQCFVCKREGAEGRDVRKCLVAACGRFYHNRCKPEEAIIW